MKFLGCLKGITFIFIWYGSIVCGFYSLYCPILPLLIIDRSLFRRATDFLFTAWESFSVAILEILYNVEFYVSGDIIDPSEVSIVLLNHRNRMDWCFFWGALAHSCYPSTHNCKIVLKDPIKKIPALGWIMQMTCFLYVKRNFQEDKNSMNAILQYFNDIKLNYQILLFPEGTNLSHSNKIKSDHFAESESFQKYNFVLHPRTNGFHYLVSKLRQDSRLQSVYDVTVMYSLPVPETEMDILKGNIPKEIHFFIQRYAVERIPTTEKELKMWLRNIWKQKECTLSKSYKFGSFTTQRKSSSPLLISYFSLIVWIQICIGKK